MSQELIYTSTPRGLKPGSQGFCTVVSTQGLAPALAQRLESLSGYRHVFGPQDANARLNPVLCSHLVLNIGGRRCHVLSRICDAGLDHTQRTNKFAHHIVLDPRELPPAGPAWLLAAAGFMQAAWDGVPRLLPAGRQPPPGQAIAGICRAWQQAAGDAGWGGALAETALANRPAVIVYRPGFDPLPLVTEALALLPPERRWNVSFSTYYNKLPPGIDCLWRCVIEGSPEAASARVPGVLVIDLAKPLGRPAETPLVRAARSGVLPQAPAAPRQATVAGAYHASDKELSQLLGGAGPPAAAMPAAISARTAADDGDYNFGPPPMGQDAMRLPPAPLRLRAKPKSLWPLIAGLVATAAILVAGIIAMWFAQRKQQEPTVATATAGSKDSAQAAGSSGGTEKNSSEVATDSASRSGSAAQGKKPDNSSGTKPPKIADNKLGDAEIEKAVQQDVARSESSAKEASEKAKATMDALDKAEVDAKKGNVDVVNSDIEEARKHSEPALDDAKKAAVFANSADKSPAGVVNLSEATIESIKQAKQRAHEVSKQAFEASERVKGSGALVRQAGITRLLTALDRRILSLPEFRKPAVEASIDLEPNSLVTVGEYQLELLGAAEVFPDKYTGKLERDANRALWFCELTPPGLGGPAKAQRIANFRIENNKLLGQFETPDLPADQAKYCDLLRNCLLRVTIAGASSQQAIVRLRAPDIENDARGLDFRLLDLNEPKMKIVPIRLFSVPKKAIIGLQIEGPSGVPAFVLQPDDVATLSIAAGKTLPVCFQVRGDWTGEDKGTYEVQLKYKGVALTKEIVGEWQDLMPQGQGGFLRVGKGAIEKHLKYVNDCLDGPRDKKGRRAELRKMQEDHQRAKDPKEREKLDKRIEAVAKEISSLERQQQDINELLTTYGQLSKCKLEYRVFLKVAGDEVDLFRTPGMK